MGLRRWTHGLWVVLGVGLGGCAGPRQGTYEQRGFDTPSNSCRTHPALCIGPESVLPGVRAAEVAVVVAGARAMLDEDAKRSVESVLKECADLARSQVLLRYHEGKFPTPAQCKEQVYNAQSESVSRAIWLGSQMHAVALECVEQKFDSMMPGRFSIEPTYRFDRRTGTSTLISKEEVQLLKQPRFRHELKGTLTPDFVIHTGDPLQVSVVYDFKFPCTNVSEPPDWRSGGSSLSGPTQKESYMQAFRLGTRQVLRVVPRLGIFE
ncbi:hypothetical protein JYK02_37070 [Corallococcus macrosporus]|uniref:Lipoprotein n=1 Tax=Corallococcus macrosporus TaxID=35 RepID=A0ABS3DP80_9BACT|nr:hypothetical protein [Corallococcus macrosporus]MBN8233141.1 hypothetical protein [Corallococcus macrosporus]